MVGIFNEQTFYSDDRDLTVTFWLCISSKAKQAGKKKLFNYVFGASGMIKRGALSQFLQAMPRKDFKDWGKALGFEGSGLTHNNLHKEMNQWTSSLCDPAASLAQSHAQGLTKSAGSAAGLYSL